MRRVRSWQATALRLQVCRFRAGHKAASYARTCYFGLIFCVAVLVYVPATDRPLRDAEAKYAEIPREMLALGDWLTPHLDYARYYEKPPLTFWTTALLYRLFGVSERTARLANIGWAFLAVLCTAILAQRLFGRASAALVAPLFLLTLEVYLYCLDAGIEFGLISCTVLAFIFFWNFYQTGSLVAAGFFYLFMGLGFLAKALPGVVIPGGVACVFLLVQHDRTKLRKLLHPLAMSVFVGTVAPWCMLMWQRHPEFFRVFIVNEHIHRLTGTMVSNDALMSTGPWLALVAGEFFPWTLYLPHAAVYCAKRLRSKTVATDKIVLLLLWTALPLVLYMISRSKVDFYALSMYPPLLILLTIPIKELLDTHGARVSYSWAYPWYLVVTLTVLAALLLIFGQDLQWVRSLHIPSVRVALIFLVVAFTLGLLIALSFVHGKVRLAFLGIALFMIVLFHTARAMFVAAFPSQSMQFAAETFNRVAAPGAMLISDERPEFEHVAVLNFYAAQPVMLLRTPESSILYFLTRDRQALCMDDADVVRLHRQGQAMYLVAATAETKNRLSRLHIPFTVLSSAGSRSLFRLEPTP